MFSYEGYDQALSLVDAVYLALPNHLHKEYAVRAAEAGVHVLCEKPMAVTEEECEAMIAAAEENRSSSWWPTGYISRKETSRPFARSRADDWETTNL